VKLKESWASSDAQMNNMLLKNEVKVSDITQEFTTKINSNLVLNQQAYYVNSQAGWENSGSVPAKVGQTTTYTIVWQAKNYFNDAKNVKVRMKLPDNVTLVDNISPDSQASRFSFDNASREIVWLAGDLKAGAGVTSDSPVIYLPRVSGPIYRTTKPTEARYSSFASPGVCKNLTRFFVRV
jgi:hypothetical protein